MQKNKFLIFLIILFSSILIYSILTLIIGVYKANKEIEKNYNNIYKLIDPSIDYSNIYVTKAQYIDNGIKLDIFITSNITPTLIIRSSKYKKTYKLNKISDNNYTIDLSLNNLENKNYTIYIKTDKERPLKTQLSLLEKIVRSKIANKLVTFNYNNNYMTFKIEDFNYLYDILIDPGHGGIDGGAVNSTIKESQLNLIQSLYEKERFEQHGLKVKLARDDDTSGMMMGDKEWNRAKQRGYAIGYNGVFAKIVYSNHHNSSENTNKTGFEILVSNKMNSNTLSTELKIFKELLNQYNKNMQNNTKKIYSRDIETGNSYDKTDGKIYPFTDYYATIRIPLELFNVKTVTYEGCYMSNKENFDWYYNEGYKIMSEIKIKFYVEALGKIYVSK
ncbi:MAG: N-acetylmuramoyl-L-alanine amidase [Bacilli bacterium]